MRKCINFASLLSVLLFVIGCAVSGVAQDTRFVPRLQGDDRMITAPWCYAPNDEMVADPNAPPCQSHEAWLKDVTHWRAERKIRIGYDGSRYDIPALQWTQNSYIQPQMMVEDRYFYDSVAGKYTVDRYLDDLTTRYGGIDAVLIWPTYPNIGVDDRNQLDMIRSMPGGVPGVKQMVSDFHRRGVRVLFPMMMWDQGTRDPGQPWPDAIAHLMAEIGADGINGDTQDGISLPFFQAAVSAQHPLAFEPEHLPHDEAVAWNLMTWGQENLYFVPQIYRDKWIESRHMINISDRWSRDKTGDLQQAFFNGVGWESWENVWGIWNGISPRDAEATRRMAAMERSFSPFLTSAGWEPFYPTNPFGLFASRWPHGNATLWTLVNRNEYDVAAARLSVPALDGARYFDVYHGFEIKPVVSPDTKQADIRVPVEAHGFGAILQVVGNPDASVVDEMARMKSMTARPLRSYSSDRQILAQHIVEMKPTAPVPYASNTVHIQGGDFLFDVMGLEIEGSNDVTVDVQYPWENAARRYHENFMRIHSFDMDKYPVTNKEFKAFLDATRYHPRDDLNFLKDWKGGTYPPGWDNKPVTWVSIEDARAYAVWAGKRLPHEWEWQYAAQGVERRKYPWGNAWRADAVPIPDENRSMRGPDNVDAHPLGASSYGVMDMVGNVWQWTDEYQDDHTRSAIVRGGSYYHPQGSKWYFPQAYQNDQHGKLLLMAPSKDRSGAIGFRCVADTDEGN